MKWKPTLITTHWGVIVEYNVQSKATEEVRIDLERLAGQKSKDAACLGLPLWHSEEELVH